MRGWGLAHALAWGKIGSVQSERFTPPLAIICTIAAASFSYFVVERRFLRIKWRLSETGSHDADTTTVVLARHGEPELPLRAETS